MKIHFHVWRDHRTVFFLPTIEWETDIKELHVAWLFWAITLDFDPLESA